MHPSKPLKLLTAERRPVRPNPLSPYLPRVNDGDLEDMPMNKAWVAINALSDT